MPYVKFFFLLITVACICGCAPEPPLAPYLGQIQPMDNNEAKKQTLNLIKQSLVTRQNLDFSYRTNGIIHSASKAVDAIVGDMRGAKAIKNGKAVIFIGSPFMADIQLFSDTTGFHVAYVSTQDNSHISLQSNPARPYDPYQVHFSNIKICAGRSDREPIISNTGWIFDWQTGSNNRLYRDCNTRGVMFQSEQQMRWYVATLLGAFPNISM